MTHIWLSLALYASVSITQPAQPLDENPVASRARSLAQETLSKAHSVEAAAPLIRLHRLLSEVDDLNLLAEPYAALLARNAVHKEVRTLARLFYADIERARGRTTKAGEWLEPMGFITDFYVAGGFDNEGKNGCDTDFGPEQKPDLKATYPGKSFEISWQKLPARTPSGFVELGTLVRPNNQTVAYALTFLQADRDTQVNLSLGTSGAYRLFVNQLRVAKSDDYHGPQVDQAKVQVRLRRGINRVLLKVCHERGPLGFFLRQERSLGPSAKVVLPEQIPPLEKGGAPSPLMLPTLADTFAALVKARPQDARLRAGYATVLAYTRAYDDKQPAAAQEAEKAATQNPNDAELHLTAGELHVHDANERRRHFEAAYKLAPDSPWTQLELARHELNQDHPEVALPMLDKLLARHPRFASAWLLKSRCLEALRQKPAAIVLVEEAFTKMPHTPPIVREAAAVARKMERPKEAVDRTRTALALRYDDTQLRQSLGMLLADLGDLNSAYEQLERALGLDPYDNALRVRLADLYAANGQVNKAKPLFAAAHAFAPFEPDVYEREGHSLLRAGEREEALAAFQKSLKLRPQNLSLKEVIRALSGHDEALSQDMSVPIAPLVQQLPKNPSDDAVFLADVTVTRVQASGLSSRFRQVAVKVFNARGIDAFRQWPITYSPDRQEVRVLKARITKSDGSIVDSYQDQEQHINEPWTGMYYDARARVLSFPALGIGDTLELVWRLEDTAQENLLSDYFGDVEQISSAYPKKFFRYSVEMPKARTLYWNTKGLPAWVKPSQKTLDSTTVWTFEAQDVPKIQPEPNMPGLSEVAATLHVSTYKTWDQVGKYWWGLVRDQLTPNDDLVKTVNQTLKGVDRKDMRAVVAAIYGFVVTNTRYVALEFGIHGYKPYRVDRVLARRFGDCKDKASLIVAMLKVAGVDAKLVLLRMRSLGALSSEPASLAAFNHAIAYVPTLDLFLDGTAEFHGTHDLPSADRVADVLVVEPNGGSQFRVTPEAKSEDNTSSLELAVTLKTDGSAELKGRTVTFGQGAPEQRRAFQSAGSRKAILEQQWAQSFPGVQVNSVNVSDTTRLEEPLKLDFQLMAPRFSEVLPAGLRFFPLGAGRVFTQVLAPLSERKTDAVFHGVWVNRFSVTFEPPPNYALQTIPEDFDEATEFGRVQLKVRVVNGKPNVSAEVSLAKARITAAEYPKFRAWLLRLDQALNRKLTLVSTSGQSAMRE